MDLEGFCPGLLEYIAVIFNLWANFHGKKVGPIHCPTAAQLRQNPETGGRCTVNIDPPYFVLRSLSYYNYAPCPFSLKIIDPLLRTACTESHRCGQI
jgi:hypothetical protein